MDKELKVKQEGKKKGFFARLVEKIDKKMEARAKESKCCGDKKSGGSSCCS